jgi:DNA-binding NtrC family response regulator
VPDVVLLDMKMGEFKGEKVLEQLLTRWPNLCVIVVTGYPSLEDMRATFKLRVFDYLSKPFLLNQLRQTLRNAIEAYGLGRTDQDRLRERLGHRIKAAPRRARLVAQRPCIPDEAQRVQISSIERGSEYAIMESLLSIARAFEKRPSEILSSIDF